MLSNGNMEATRNIEYYYERANYLCSGSYSDKNRTKRVMRVMHKPLKALVIDRKSVKPRRPKLNFADQAYYNSLTPERLKLFGIEEKISVKSSSEIVLRRNLSSTISTEQNYYKGKALISGKGKSVVSSSKKVCPFISPNKKPSADASSSKVKTIVVEKKLIQCECSKVFRNSPDLKHWGQLFIMPKIFSSLEMAPTWVELGTDPKRFDIETGDIPPGRIFVRKPDPWMKVKPKVRYLKVKEIDEERELSDDWLINDLVIDDAIDDNNQERVSWYDDWRSEISKMNIVLNEEFSQIDIEEVPEESLRRKNSRDKIHKIFKDAEKPWNYFY